MIINVLSIGILLNFVLSVDIQSLSDGNSRSLVFDGDYFTNGTNGTLDHPGTKMMDALRSVEVSNLTTTNSSNSISELFKSNGIPNFLSQLVKIDPTQVKPIVKLLKGLMITINDEIKKFQVAMNNAKGVLDKAQANHKDKESEFAVKGKNLKSATTIYVDSKKQLNEAKIAKGVAETKYNDAKTAYGTSIQELDSANKAKAKAESNYNDAKTAYDTSETELNTARRIKNDAEVKHKDAKTTYDTNKPGLLSNIATIKDIIAKLDQMLFKLVRHVASRDNTTKVAWKKYCAKFGNVTVNSVMKITMGQYIDFFKPAKTMTFCDFLWSKSFEWSTKFVGPYVKPKYYTHKSFYGGAEKTWSIKNAGGRTYLPFWGYEGKSHGGCCVSKPGESTWFRSFDMHLFKY